jgi:hypothetical protein
MAFSLGVFAVRTTSGGTFYRWESDQGQSGTGFVLFNAENQTVRPSDAKGDVVGTLVVDGRSGELTGVSDGIDRANFMRVAASILKAHAKTGEVPATAHAYYG